MDLAKAWICEKGPLTMCSPNRTSIRPKYYAKYKIDPWTFIIENQLGMDVGSVVKYVVRHKDKNGVEDLNKAIKCLEMMKEYYYNEKS